jgi:hypothetical protein
MDKDGELSQYYLGTAQVRLQNLRYSPSSTETDDCTGCCISDLEHNLPVLITPSQYQESLASSSVSENTLYQIGLPPKISLPSLLELPCLHGRFRLEFAKKNGSNETDDWWSIDLYTSGEYYDRVVYLNDCLPSNIRTQCYDNSASPTLYDTFRSERW